MKAYRVKHIPSGLYYQPTCGRNNLSKKGKVYITPQNILNNRGADYIYISMNENSKLMPVKGINFERKSLFGGWSSLRPAKVPKSDFEIEYL